MKSVRRRPHQLDRQPGRLPATNTRSRSPCRRPHREELLRRGGQTGGPGPSPRLTHQQQPRPPTAQPRRRRRRQGPPAGPPADQTAGAEGEAARATEEADQAEEATYEEYDWDDEGVLDRETPSARRSRRRSRWRRWRQRSRQRPLQGQRPGQGKAAQASLEKWCSAGATGVLWKQV